MLAGVCDLTGEDVLRQPFITASLPLSLVSDVSMDSYRCVGDWTRIGEGLAQGVTDPIRFVVSVDSFAREHISDQEAKAMDGIRFWGLGNRVRNAVDARNEDALKKLVCSMLKGIRSKLADCSCLACDAFFESAREWKYIQRDLIELGEDDVWHCRSCVEAYDYVDDRAMMTAFARFLLRHREYCASFTNAAFSGKRRKYAKAA